MVSAVHEHPIDMCNIDLLLKKSKLPVELSENIAFSLLNTSKIPQRDANLTDILSPRPEPPKNPKITQRKFPLIDKTIDKKLDSTIEKSDLIRRTPPPPDEIKRYSPVPKISNIKGSRRRGLLEATKPADRKDVRVRSITPVDKHPGTAKRKTKTPVFKKTIK